MTTKKKSGSSKKRSGSKAPKSGTRSTSSQTRKPSQSSKTRESSRKPKKSRQARNSGASTAPRSKASRERAGTTSRGSGTSRKQSRKKHSGTGKTSTRETASTIKGGSRRAPTTSKRAAASAKPSKSQRKQSSARKSAGLTSMGEAFLLLAKKAKGGNLKILDGVRLPSGAVWSTRLQEWQSTAFSSQEVPSPQSEPETLSAGTLGAEDGKKTSTPNTGETSAETSSLPTATGKRARTKEGRKRLRESRHFDLEQQRPDAKVIIAWCERWGAEYDRGPTGYYDAIVEFSNDLSEEVTDKDSAEAIISAGPDIWSDLQDAAAEVPQPAYVKIHAWYPELDTHREANRKRGPKRYTERLSLLGTDLTLYRGTSRPVLSQNTGNAVFSLYARQRPVRWRARLEVHWPSKK